MMKKMVHFRFGAAGSSNGHLSSTSSLIWGEEEGGFISYFTLTKSTADKTNNVD